MSDGTLQASMTIASAIEHSGLTKTAKCDALHRPPYQSRKVRDIVESKTKAADFYAKWNKYQLEKMYRFAQEYCFIKCERCGCLESCNHDQLAAKRYCGDCKKALAEIRPVVLRAMRGMRLPPASTYTCIDCGSPAAVWEHRRYDRPHEVVATCHPCNKRRGPAKW